MTDLMPNAQYELWVTATNTTGISPASEKALYMTGNTGLTPTATSEVIKLVTVEIIVLLSQDVPPNHFQMCVFFLCFVVTPASHD